MISYYSCEDYLAVICRESGNVNAPMTCARLERERNDGFRVIACRNGAIIADSDGYIPARRPDEFDLACERKHDR